MRLVRSVAFVRFRGVFVVTCFLGLFIRLPLCVFVDCFVVTCFLHLFIRLPLRVFASIFAYNKKYGIKMSYFEFANTDRYFFTGRLVDVGLRLTGAPDEGRLFA